MEVLRNNIIKETILELQYNGSRDGFALQNEITSWANDDLVRIVDEHLEKFDQPDKITRIDKLHIEIEVSEGNNWINSVSGKIGAQLNHELRNKLSIVLNSTGAEQVSIAKGFFEAFIYFLQNGYLPWWSQPINKEDFFSGIKQFIQSEPAFEMKKMLVKSLKPEVAKKRLLSQMPDEIFLNIVSVVLPGIKQQVNNLWRDIIEIVAGAIQEQRKNLSEIFKATVLETIYVPAEQQIAGTVVKAFIKTAISTGSFDLIKNKLDIVKEESLKREIADAIFRLDSKQDIEDIEESQTEASIEFQNAKYKSKIDDVDSYAEAINQSEGIYINNAGLVIVASFLPLLFKKLLLVDGGKINEVNKAIYLVQFLASGIEDIPEFELVLAKILCGADIQKPIDTVIHFDENEKKEVKEVLLSVIEYWNVLKDTSVDGLRESFLMRKGKLWLENNEWQLLVEQKSYDMLLQHLPWSISMIKLPWMNRIIKTQWVT